MRYIDKFRTEHIHDYPPPTAAGHLVCPEYYGYEDGSYACDEMASCKECWEREIPERRMSEKEEALDGELRHHND